MRKSPLDDYLAARKKRIDFEIFAAKMLSELLEYERKKAKKRADQVATIAEKLGVLGTNDQILFGVFADLRDITTDPDEQNSHERLAAWYEAGKPFCNKRKSCRKSKSASAPASDGNVQPDTIIADGKLEALPPVAEAPAPLPEPVHPGIAPDTGALNTETPARGGDVARIDTPANDASSRTKPTEAEKSAAITETDAGASADDGHGDQELGGVDAPASAVGTDGTATPPPPKREVASGLETDMPPAPSPGGLKSEPAPTMASEGPSVPPMATNPTPGNAGSENQPTPRPITPGKPTFGRPAVIKPSVPIPKPS